MDEHGYDYAKTEALAQAVLFLQTDANAKTGDAIKVAAVFEAYLRGEM